MLILSHPNTPNLENFQPLPLLNIPKIQKNLRQKYPLNIYIQLFFILLKNIITPNDTIKPSIISNLNKKPLHNPPHENELF